VSPLSCILFLLFFVSKHLSSLSYLENHRQKNKTTHYSHRKMVAHSILRRGSRAALNSIARQYSSVPNVMVRKVSFLSVLSFPFPNVVFRVFDKKKGSPLSPFCIGRRETFFFCFARARAYLLLLLLNLSLVLSRFAAVVVVVLRPF
jgi:hypothetical protein